jgi:hypothetical protein
MVGRAVEEASRIATKSVANLNGAQKQAAANTKAQRVASPTGRDLAQQCEDWRRAYEQGHSQTARAEMDRNCRRYEAYLATGIPSPR